MTIRPGTNDHQVFIDVVVKDEYRLPSAFEENTTVLDIGGHIGCFSYAVLRRGAGKVFVFEPFRENFVVLLENLKEFGDKVIPINAAVWRSDAPMTLLAQDDVDFNKGSMSVYGTKHPCWGIPLDDILGVTGPIDLMKIDCEGAEWDILSTSKRLWQVHRIVGEYHETATHKYPELEKLLTKEGFTVTRHELKRTNDQFWATRRE